VQFPAQEKEPSLEEEYEEYEEYNEKGEKIEKQPAEKPNEALYSLYSVCCHAGNLNSGHYTSYTRLIDPLTGMMHLLLFFFLL
jgi:uncharacterized UBP type Zn finger protein